MALINNLVSLQNAITSVYNYSDQPQNFEFFINSKILGKGKGQITLQYFTQSRQYHIIGMKLINDKNRPIPIPGGINLQIIKSGGATNQTIFYNSVKKIFENIGIVTN